MIRLKKEKERERERETEMHIYNVQMLITIKCDSEQLL